MAEAMESGRTRHIFVTGGVASSLGKGLTASSLGNLLRARGLKVVAFAGNLDHPRWLYRLPNGDILVAETNSPPRNVGGVTGMVMNSLMKIVLQRSTLICLITAPVL